MLTGTPPFDGKTDNQIYGKIVQGEYKMEERSWKGISSDAKDLVKKMLCFNSKERISAEEALNHKWISTFREVPQEQDNVFKNCLENLRKFQAQSKLQVA